MLERQDATAQLKALYNGLIADCERAEEARRACDDPYSRRVTIRALFAMIEGLSFSMKDVVRTALNEFPEVVAKLGFKRSDIAILYEESYGLNDKGSAKARPSFLRLIPNLRFAMSSYARIFTVKWEPDCNTVGWRALNNLVDVRNRITHPKDPNDLQITDDDMSTFIQGGAWHRDTVKDLLDACAAKQ